MKVIVKSTPEMWLKEKIEKIDIKGFGNNPKEWDEGFNKGIELMKQKLDKIFKECDEK